MFIDEVRLMFIDLNELKVLLNFVALNNCPSSFGNVQIGIQFINFLECLYSPNN